MLRFMKAGISACVVMLAVAVEVVLFWKIFRVGNGGGVIRSRFFVNGSCHLHVWWGFCSGGGGGGGGSESGGFRIGTGVCQEDGLGCLNRRTYFLCCLSLMCPMLAGICSR